MTFDPEAQRQRFDEIGEARVRDTAMSWSSELQAFAYDWLRDRDAERETQRRAEHDAQLEMARVAKTASFVAAWASVIAVLIAIATLVVSILALRNPAT